MNLVFHIGVVLSLTMLVFNVSPSHFTTQNGFTMAPVKLHTGINMSKKPRTQSSLKLHKIPNLTSNNIRHNFNACSGCKHMLYIRIFNDLKFILLESFFFESSGD